MVRVAESFKDAYNLLRLPLKEKAHFDAYYVPREDSPIGELVKEILMDEQPSKMLFTGHRASGKTTELLRLMFMLKDNYFFIYFSALEELELADLDYKDVLLSLILKTLRTLEERKIGVSDDIVEDLYDLLKELSGVVVSTRIEEKARGWDVGAKLPLYIIGLSGRYKTEAVTRREIRQKAEYLVQDVIQRFNLLVADIQQRVKRPVLVIVDDLEKADLASAEEIFYRHSATLIQPNCKVIFTVPVAMMYSSSLRQIQMSFPICRFLPLRKVRNKDGSRNEGGTAFLKDIFLKRASSELFEEEALEKLADGSGGVVVDFLRMAGECCVKAENRGLRKVSEDLVGETFDGLISDYKRVLREELYPKLSEVHCQKDTKNDEQLRSLLHLLAVLEYDREGWYDVHPAVVPLLMEKGLV